MTVSELIEFLKTQDQGAAVEIVEHKSGKGYYDQGGNASKQYFDPSIHVEYTDFTGNPYVKEGEPHHNRRILFLGEING